MPSESRPPRRQFFRQALRSLLEAVDEVVEDRVPWTPSEASRKRVHLRPPGAIPEAEFLETCTRSGACVEVCPVKAIQVVVSRDPSQDGTPFLLAQERACVVCDDLSCMKACPSGALELLPREQIDMGVAVIEDSLCRRNFREDCTECVDRCPLGPTALTINDYGRLEVRDGCVGCGVCEHYCPTSPRAIRVHPS